MHDKKYIAPTKVSWRNFLNGYTQNMFITNQKKKKVQHKDLEDLMKFEIARIIQNTIPREIIGLKTSTGKK